MDTLSVTQIHNEFIIFSGNLGFIIFFAKTLCVLYLLREFIICSLSVPRIHYGIIDFRMTFFRPKNNLFWPFRWPWMTMIFTPLESELNLESNHMHSMCIWPCFRFMTPEWLFLTPLMTSTDLEMHIIKFIEKILIEWYAYHVHLAIFHIFDP